MKTPRGLKGKKSRKADKQAEEIVLFSYRSSCFTLDTG